MGSQTANLALPYPVGTDLIADGDNAIQALAEKLDGLLWSGLGPAAPWVIVGSGGTAPAFGAGWSNYAGGYSVCAFRKVGNLVYVRGLANALSTVAANAPIFTLPAGYRPPGNLIVATFTAVGAIRLDIQTNGVIANATGGFTAGQYITLTVPPFFVD